MVYLGYLGLLCEYELLCSISCTLDLIFSFPLLFRWSWGAVRSSPVAQGLQHRLCRLRERCDSRRGGTTSGGGRLKQSQNITLFGQIVWHHRSSQHHVYCCNYFSIFLYTFLCLLYWKNYIVLIMIFFVLGFFVFFSPSLCPTIIMSSVGEHGVTRQAKSRIKSVLFLWQTTEHVLAYYLNSVRWDRRCLCRLDCLLSVPYSSRHQTFLWAVAVVRYCIKKGLKETTFRFIDTWQQLLNTLSKTVYDIPHLWYH